MKDPNYPFRFVPFEFLENCAQQARIEAVIARSAGEERIADMAIAVAEEMELAEKRLKKRLERLANKKYPKAKSLKSRSLIMLPEYVEAT